MPMVRRGKKAGFHKCVIYLSTRDIGPGDAFVIPSGAEHGCLCLEAGELIDSFTPRRDDFL